MGQSVTLIFRYAGMTPVQSCRLFGIMKVDMWDIERICNSLDAAFGKPILKRHNPPLDELVLTILSQNTTSANCQRAFENLRSKFPSWDDVRTAPVRKIAESIRCGGLADIKAGRIRSILQQIYDHQGTLDLEWLSNLSIDDAASYLLRFEGVGPKTASCVLLFSLCKPALPVDTHVHRVALRVGLIPAGADANAAHRILREVVPPERVYSFHMNAIALGRKICRPTSPKCEICPLNRECDFGRKRLGVE
jgi:endonuclease III